MLQKRIFLRFYHLYYEFFLTLFCILWSPKSKVVELLLRAFISTRLISYLARTNPRFGFGLSIYTVELLTASGGEFAANSMKGLSWL